MFRDLQIWLNHFEYHAQHPRRIPAGLSDVLKPHERRLIARSIAVFQLGELSEGNALLRTVWRFVQKHRDASTVPGAAPRPAIHGGRSAPVAGPHPLVRIIELFVREEQRHAALLRAFMEDHDIALKPTDWTDFVFCCLRRLGGLELRLHIFIAAELIASVYYRALEVATGCQRLKILCRTVVADELAHIGLQSQLLLTLRARKPAPLRAAIRLLHRAFFATTASVVYLTHRGVLHAAGYDLGSFVRACATQYAFYLEPPVTCRESGPKPFPRA